MSDAGDKPFLEGLQLKGLYSRTSLVFVFILLCLLILGVLLMITVLLGLEWINELVTNV